MKRVSVLLALCLLAAALSGCGEPLACSLPVQPPALQSADLMKNINAKPAGGKAADDRFINSAADFSIELFKRGVSEKENTLISPLSVLLALSMTENGAASDTLREMEAAVGRGIPIDDRNEYLSDLLKGLLAGNEAALSIANSIWFRDAPYFTVEEAFLQKNANYYNAAAYKADFDAPETVDNVNRWVKEKTDGMIEGIIEEIGPDVVMYLINAIAFDALWERPYTEYAVREGVFTAWNNTARPVDFMYSDEYTCFKSDDAKGFIKPYIGRYEFAALLPDEGIDINTYVQSLTGEKFLGLLNNTQYDKVATAIPKFRYEYSVTLNGVLKDMGMPLAFDKYHADFSKLAHSDRGNIYISNVIHKTFIEVSELGTKAGAATAVEISNESGPADSVILDRPFIYAIVDAATKLPVFIGTVMSIT